MDDRNRAEVALPDMSGYEDTVFMYKTAGGQVGTAGQWPSDRKITGVIMHSPAQFHIKHSEWSGCMRAGRVSGSAVFKPGRLGRRSGAGVCLVMCSEVRAAAVQVPALCHCCCS